MPDEPSLLPPGPLPLIGPDFYVISPLGRVGDGLVYAARDGLTRVRLREYAPPGVVRRGPDGALEPSEDRFASAWRDGLDQFLAKGEALTGVTHPGIAPVFAVRPGGYLIGAPVGEPLSATLAGGLGLPPHEVQLLARDLAAALAEVHARGLTHLDVSADTVSIASGTVQLTDFAVDNRRFLPLLESQDGFVRPGYSPIELHDGTLAEPLGPRTDVYAASALVFRLITGRDPAPWQDRWRDPSTSDLTAHDCYPADFLAAIRQGMAVEPEQRFADAASWLSAMGPPPAPPIAPLTRDVPPAPVPPPPQPVPVAPPPPRRRSWGTPLLILAVILLGAATGGIFAWQEGWFAPAATDEPTETNIVARPEPEPTREPQTPARPEIQPGGTVSGLLTRNDERGAGGRYQDSFTLAGRRGQRLELRLSSTDFDPLVEMTGPGFQASNDDDADKGTRDSRLAVTLPRNGAYTVTVTSSTGGATGAYLLELVEPEPDSGVVTIDLGLASRLAGEWHAIDDVDCEQPAVNSVFGDQFISRIDGNTYRHRIIDTRGDTIRTVVVDGRLEGRRFDFRMGPGGDSYEIAGERWVRC